MNSDIYLRVPVNKVSSIVVNQCGCADELQLNNLLQERDQLRKNLTQWMQQSSSSKGLARTNKLLIVNGSKQVMQLNTKLKAYDIWHRKQKPKSYGDAFISIAKQMLQSEVFNHIDFEAKNLINN